MKKQKDEQTVTSVDGKRTITLDEFDRLADSGSDDIDQFLDWDRAQRGGARPGSGRKRKDAVRLEVMIRPELREKLRRRAREKGSSQVKLIEEAIERL